MKPYLLFFILGAHVAAGQTTDSTTTTGLPPQSDFKYSFLFETGVTLASTSIPNIRSFIRSNQIRPDFHIDPMINFGLGGRYGRIKAMLQVGGGFSFTSLPSDGDSLVARQNTAGYTGATLGFDVANTRNRRLYINVGYGGIGYEYSIYRRTNRAVPFQDLLAYNQPGNVPSLQVTNEYWDINIEYTHREKRKRSAENVIRFGYRRGIQTKAWESDAFRLTGAPTDRISQFYFQAGYYFSSNYAKRTKR